jgi:hypothetical protein
MTNDINLPTYFENSRFIAFDMYKRFNRYFGLYNKSSRTFKISGNTYGILNNLDGFINPTFVLINESEELIGISDPSEVLDWFKQNADNINSLLPEVKQLQKIKESDNPVVIIESLKILIWDYKQLRVFNEDIRQLLTEKKKAGGLLAN